MEKGEEGRMDPEQEDERVKEDPEREGKEGEEENKVNSEKINEDDQEMVLDEKGGAEGGEGDLGGLLEGGGLTSMKKGSSPPQEPTGKLDPLEAQKNDKEEK